MLLFLLASSFDYFKSKPWKNEDMNYFLADQFINWRCTKGLIIAEGGQAFSLEFSLLKTTSPKLRAHPLHQTESHLILGACNGEMEFGRLIKTISSSKVLECENVCLVCESNHLIPIRFFSYVRLLFPLNAKIVSGWY